MARVKKGDSPLGDRQTFSRSLRRYNLFLHKAGARKGDELALATIPHADLPQRLLDIIAALPGTSTTFAEVLLLRDAFINKELSTNNFNRQIPSYMKAVHRLSKYILSVGRPGKTEQQPTGEVDAEGVPITETVTTEDIAPLPLTITKNTYDEFTGELTGSVSIPNPPVVKDEAERNEAQAIVDNTPAGVISFVGDN